MYGMTAAHRTMPLPSYALVRNPANGREVVVRINDRGPFHRERIIDLSYAAALKLGVLRGVAPVEVQRLTHDDIRAGNWRGAKLQVAAAPEAPLPAPPPPVATPTASPSATAAENPPIAAADGGMQAPQDSATASTAGYWVQLGAFRQRQGASDLQQQIETRAGLARTVAGGLRRQPAVSRAGRPLQLAQRGRGCRPSGFKTRPDCRPWWCSGPDVGQPGGAAAQQPGKLGLHRARRSAYSARPEPRRRAAHRRRPHGHEDPHCQGRTRPVTAHRLEQRQPVALRRLVRAARGLRVRRQGHGRAGHRPRHQAHRAARPRTARAPRRCRRCARRQRRWSRATSSSSPSRATAARCPTCRAKKPTSWTRPGACTTAS